MPLSPLELLSGDSRGGRPAAGKILAVEAVKFGVEMLNGSQRLQTATKITLSGKVPVLQIPLGTLPDMPLPLAFGSAAGLLPVTKSGIWEKPFLTDSAGSLYSRTFLSHRLLPQFTFGRTMHDF